jgi:hypothetical protein
MKKKVFTGSMSPSQVPKLFSSGVPVTCHLNLWSKVYSTKDHGPAPPTGQSPSLISGTWPSYTAHSVSALGYLSRSPIYSSEAISGGHKLVCADREVLPHHHHPPPTSTFSLPPKHLHQLNWPMPPNISTAVRLGTAFILGLLAAWW